MDGPRALLFPSRGLFFPFSSRIWLSVHLSQLSSVQLKKPARFLLRARFLSLSHLYSHLRHSTTEPRSLKGGVNEAARLSHGRSRRRGKQVRLAPVAGASLPIYASYVGSRHRKLPRYRCVRAISYRQRLRVQWTTVVNSLENRRKLVPKIMHISFALNLT